MIAEMLLITVHFITVNAPDGEEVRLNVSEISSIRHPQEGSDKHFAKDTHCIITMANGKFIGTVDNCVDILRKIMEAEK